MNKPVLRELLSGRIDPQDKLLLISMALEGTPVDPAELASKNSLSAQQMQRCLTRLAGLRLVDCTPNAVLFSDDTKDLSRMFAPPPAPKAEPTPTEPKPVRRTRRKARD